MDVPGEGYLRQYKGILRPCIALVVEKQREVA